MSLDKFCRFTLFDKVPETCAKQDALSIYLIFSGQPPRPLHSLHFYPSKPVRPLQFYYPSLCASFIFIEVLCVPFISIYLHKIKTLNCWYTNTNIWQFKFNAIFYYNILFCTSMVQISRYCERRCLSVEPSPDNFQVCDST